MINRQLIKPQSIVVVGGSDNTAKPGGKILKNIKDGGFKGRLVVLNPKADQIQGLPSYRKPEDLPPCELAILAIAARHCPSTVEFLAKHKHTKAVIILSAGFGEESQAGAKLENQLSQIVEDYQLSLIGPNCIGLLNGYYQAVFTSPVPPLAPNGVDFISASGATAVFVIESGMPLGLRFSSVFSVGNSISIAVEDVLKYMDESFDPQHDSKTKILYIESIRKPDTFLKHAASLRRKGCRIAAIKAGSSDAGSRAASSHTGALAGSDTAVDALFRKAGVLRCYSRRELITVAALFSYPPLNGKRLAVITHAGGPAVMLTDALAQGRLEVPQINSPKKKDLSDQLFAGSSVENPIDFLATGTAEQLGMVIDYCNHHFKEVDAMAVIFGSPGLFNVESVYRLLHKRMISSDKPIYPILPSTVNAANAITYFQDLGHATFPDEVAFGRALAKVYHTPDPLPDNDLPDFAIDRKQMEPILKKYQDAYLSPDDCARVLDIAGITRVKEKLIYQVPDWQSVVSEIPFPWAMKVTGPLHKSDVGGVVLNINSIEQAESTYERLMQIESAEAVLIQAMLSGRELFAGVKREPPFGHLLACGLGGIFVELMQDVTFALSPLSRIEAQKMIERLRAYPLLKGYRGQTTIALDAFVDTLCRLSALVSIVPEISELDLNPLLADQDGIVAVDSRIRVRHLSEG